MKNNTHTHTQAFLAIEMLRSLSKYTEIVEFVENTSIKFEGKGGMGSEYYSIEGIAMEELTIIINKKYQFASILCEDGNKEVLCWRA